MRHSFAVWNLEYQRVGDHPEHGGGGWLATCLDVASAIDLLAATGQTLAAGRLDLSRVVAIGHSFEISADDGPTRGLGVRRPAARRVRLGREGRGTRLRGPVHHQRLGAS